MRNTKLLLLIIAGLFVAQTVAAFGVTAPYWKDNPLIMNPGQTRELEFTLQNMVGEDDITIVVDIVQGAPYVELIGEKQYDVPIRVKDIPVKFKLSIPAETPLGTKYPLSISFRSTSKSGAQQVQLGTAIEKRFDIIVGEVKVPKKEYALLSQPATPALIILVIVFIIWLLLRKSRKNKAGRAALAMPDQNAKW